jgi:hypothetical protein
MASYVGSRDSSERHQVAHEKDAVLEGLSGLSTVFAPLFAGAFSPVFPHAENSK